MIDGKAIGTGEKVEAELTHLMERRNDQRVAEEGHRPSEEMYEESTRRYQEQMRAGPHRVASTPHGAGRKAPPYSGGPDSPPHKAGREVPAERSSMSETNMATDTSNTSEVQDLPDEVVRFAEARQEHSKNTATIGLSYRDAVDEIRAVKTLEGPYVDRLDGGQYRAALRELKDTQAEEKRAKYIADYVAELERHEQDVAPLRQPMQQRLYGLSEAGTAAIPGLAASSPQTVSETLEVAIMSGNKDLAKAAFTIASHRGLGDVQSRYFTEVDPDARLVYETYLQLPSDEQLAERRHNVERLFPKLEPESLMPSANGTT